MIQANELRIGNWVKQDGDIEKVSFKTFELLNDLDTYYLKPIPLTEEILDKCGFEKLGTYENVFRKNNIRIHLGGDKTALLILETESSSFKKIIFSLHDFQNLYFALTGEELEVKM